MHHLRRNLVIATVGDDSQHSSWLAQRYDRSFDVALVYYGKQTDRYRGESEYYVERRGFKFPLISHFLAELGVEPATVNVIATGGLAPVVVDECRSITDHQPWLTLLGLELVFQRNA